MRLVRGAALLYGAVLACHSAINIGLQTGCGNERERTLGIIYFCICGSFDLSCAVRAFSGRSTGKGLRAALGNDRRRQPWQHTGFCHQLAAWTVFQDRTWFPIKRNSLAKAEAWYGKYGRWSLLLSWMPVVGDPITLVAGILREPFLSFIAIVAVAKTVRYIVVALITLQFT